MSRRTTRSDTLHDTGPLLATLADCRRALIETQTKAKAMGPLYQACGMVVASIDALAVFLTGQPYPFATGGNHSALSRGPASERQDESS